MKSSADDDLVTLPINMRFGLLSILLLVCAKACKGSAEALSEIPFAVFSVAAELDPCAAIYGENASGRRELAINISYHSVCFAASNSPIDPRDVLTITGSNFSTMIDLRLTVDKYDCTPINSQQRSIVISDTLIQCQLPQHVPQIGETPAFFTFNGTTVPLSAWGFTLLAACPSGTEATNWTCTECGNGATCLGGLEASFAKAQYWKQDTSAWSERGIDPFTQALPQFVRCPYPDSCAGNQTCNAGHSGWACTSCASGWASKQGGVCLPCVSTLLHACVLVVAIVGGFIFAQFLISRAMKRRSKVVIVSRMLVNFLQMTSALRVYLAFNTAPAFTKDAVRLSDASNFVSFEIPSLSCTLQLGFNERFLMYMALPPLAVIVPLALLVARSIIGQKLPTCGCKHLSLHKALRITGTCTGVLLFFMHNSISAAILKSWNCSSTATGAYLISQPDVACHSGQHMLVQTVLAPIFLLLYSIGIPLAGFAALWRQREALGSMRTLKYYGFSYDGYRLEVFWFECFVMVRKLAFIAAGVLIKDAQLQLVTGLLLLVAVLCLHLHNRPYHESFLNGLESIALLGNLVLYASILVHSIALDRGDVALQDAVGWVLIAANGLVLACFLFAFMIALRQHAILAARKITYQEPTFSFQTLQLADNFQLTPQGTKSLSRVQRALRHAKLAVANAQIQAERQRGINFQAASMGSYKPTGARQRRPAVLALSDHSRRQSARRLSSMVWSNQARGPPDLPTSVPSRSTSARPSIISFSKPGNHGGSRHGTARQSIAPAADEAPTFRELLPSWLGGAQQPLEGGFQRVSRPSSMRRASVFPMQARRFSTALSPQAAVEDIPALDRSQRPSAHLLNFYNSNAQPAALAVPAAAPRFSLTDPFSLEELHDELIQAAGLSQDTNVDESSCGAIEGNSISPRAGQIVRNPLASSIVAQWLPIHGEQTVRPRSQAPSASTDEFEELRAVVVDKPTSLHVGNPINRRNTLAPTGKFTNPFNMLMQTLKTVPVDSSQSTDTVEFFNPALVGWLAAQAAADAPRSRPRKRGLGSIAESANDKSARFSH